MALEQVFESMCEDRPALRLAAFVSASGSAGTLGAGDRLKADHGARIVVAEALECPTLLRNGFGEHNIQGIGDKHVPLIHNVMNTDLVVDVSDRATDELNAVIASPAGRAVLIEAGVPSDLVADLDLFGLSSLCNVVAAIKTARHYGLGPDDVVMTIATDGAAMYRTEAARITADRFGGGVTGHAAARVLGAHLLGADDSNVLELTHAERQRVFNLGYFTWVEQRGLDTASFTARARPEFWAALEPAIERWDRLIDALNEEVGAGS